jgi:hypothetical protein
MATKYPKSAQTGESGVAFVRKAVTDAGGIFRGSETPDIGIDAVIEFLTSGREPSGTLFWCRSKWVSPISRVAAFTSVLIATILKRGRGTRSRVPG